jgi:NAD(P)-dependent dehydrogenase (short-subunit alcohol dehydrogenase family)
MIETIAVIGAGNGGGKATAVDLSLQGKRVSFIDKNGNRTGSVKLCNLMAAEMGSRSTP